LYTLVLLSKGQRKIICVEKIRDRPPGRSALVTPARIVDKHRGGVPRLSIYKRLVWVLWVKAIALELRLHESTPLFGLLAGRLQVLWVFCMQHSAHAV